MDPVEKELMLNAMLDFALIAITKPIYFKTGAPESSISDEKNAANTETGESFG